MRVVLVKSFIVIAGMHGLVVVEAATLGLVGIETATLGPVIVIAVILGSVSVETVALGSVVIVAAADTASAGATAVMRSVGILDLMDDMDRLDWVKFVSTRPVVRVMRLLSPRVLEAATRTSVVVTSLSGSDESSNDSRFEHRDLNFCILIILIG